MGEEIAPISRVLSGIYDLWFEDRHKETRRLNQLEAYNLMNNPLPGLIGMRRRVKMKLRNGRKNRWSE